MSGSAFLAIDPGLSGALALYEAATDTFEIADIPTFKVGGKTSIDEQGLARIIDNWSALVREVWLEQVQAMPGGGERRMGATSAFTFGRGYGLIRGICAANFLPIMDVPPGVWKRSMGVPGKISGNDDAGRLRASQLMPRHAHHWTRKKDSGRSDAALIALYAARQHERAAA